MGGSCAKESGSSSGVVFSGTDVAAFAKLLGPTLLTKSGEVPTSEALAGKAGVCIYFSAHWCPPCRGFTPKLAQAYKEHLAAKGIEIIFVSSDKDQSAFKSYFGSMPWLSVPFGERKVKQALSERFSVSGIPKLVVLDGEAKLVTADGRGKVMSDPTGSSWLPEPKPLPAAAAEAGAAKPTGLSPTPASVAAAAASGLAALLGTEPLLDTDGKTAIELPAVVKDAPLIALYFSAHWCGPCRAFTPKLVTFVEMLKEEGVHLPVVFGSSDRDEAAFADYFASMPWCAFPHGDKRIEALKAKFGVSGIPWLVVLDKDGNLVMNEADTVVPKGPQAYQEWVESAKKIIKPAAASPAA